MIDLYADTKILNWRTANNLFAELAHRTGYNMNRSEKYDNIIAKYINAEPATMRIARQIEAQNKKS